MLSSISPAFDEQVLDAIVREAGGRRHTAWRFGVGFRAGDSYLSEAFRLHIDAIAADGSSPMRVQCVVKAMPRNRARRETFRSAEFFANESRFYQQVVPTFRRFQAERNVPESQAFNEWPRLYYAHTDGSADFIVLEDLSRRGFASAPRKNAIDLAHCRLIMQTLGKFHAVSLAMSDQKPDLLARVARHGTREVYYAEQYRDWYAAFLRSQVEVARDAMCREFGGTEYERRMHCFTDGHFYDRMIALVERRNRYCVIGHGDCWLPNFLVQYAGLSSNPTGARMIDFQLARFASPALDIAFFIYSCTEQGLREAHFDELLHTYYASCSTLIRALGSDPVRVFPWPALLEEMRQCARFGVGMGMESIPMSLLSDKQVPDLNALVGEQPVPLADVLVIRPMKKTAHRRRLADMFRHAIDKGYLDE